MWCIYSHYSDQLNNGTEDETKEEQWVRIVNNVCATISFELYYAAHKFHLKICIIETL